MRQRTIIVAAITTVLTVAAPTSFAALSQLHTGGKVTVRMAGANNGKEVTNGSVAGSGHFTATGAIMDKEH